MLVRVGTQVQEVLRRTIVRRRGTTQVKTTRLRVALCDVEPTVARVIDVPASATLPELHELLQAAIGWTDSHLHQFVTSEATYGMEIPGGDVWPEDQRDETGALLVDLGARFEYLYDFGDGWTHDVEVLGPGGPAPGCVDGYGACPPEDCGGPGGYAELLDVLADPAHPEHEHMRGWVGNRLRPFDRTATDQRVRQVVGEVPESVRLLLDLAADGVRLTPGGRLPRTVVRSIQQHRPHWHPLGRPAATEDDCRPWERCTTCCARWGCCDCATACSPPPAPPATISRGPPAQVGVQPRHLCHRDHRTRRSAYSPRTVPSTANSSRVRYIDCLAAVGSATGNPSPSAMCSSRSPSSPRSCADST